MKAIHSFCKKFYSFCKKKLFLFDSSFGKKYSISSLFKDLSVEQFGQFLAASFKETIPLRFPFKLLGVIPQSLNLAIVVAGSFA